MQSSEKTAGNYYGTPRPVHISAESPPITYQEHRNLLRNFRTRSKSLSNLEKTPEESVNGEDDSGLQGGSGGVRRGNPAVHRSPGRPRASSSGGVGHVAENGIIGSRRGARIRGVMPDHWEQAFSDPGESLYIERSPKRTSWLSPRPSSREALYRNEWFTDHPDELRGYPVHVHLIKGSRGFGFNIVGGSRPRELLQVYSVTTSGPSTLKTADILVYINDVCVLGKSHKEVVGMLKSVPVGHSVDVEVKRGYPMLYNPNGLLKQPSPRSLDSEGPILPPTTTQPQSLHPLPRLSTPAPQTQHYNEVHSDGGYTQPGVTLDANGNATPFASRPPPPYRCSSVSDAATPSPVHPPRSLKSLARLQSLDPTQASQSDSEVVSAIGSHRKSLIRNHNNNSLSTPPHLLHYGTSKSSESDLSNCTIPGARLPLPESPRRPSSSSAGPRSTHPQLYGPRTAHLRAPTPESPRHHSFNGIHGNTSPNGSPSDVSSPGAMSVGSGFGSFSGGELVPVALAQAEGDRGLGFSLAAGGHRGRVTVVERVWDRKQCSSLQPGDAIVKINGADVQSLSCAQIQTILQEHTKQGEVILLIYRGGNYHSSISPGSARRLPPPLLHPPPPPVGSDNSSALSDILPMPMPRTSPIPPPSPIRMGSSLIQSTSFLESIPVTLTMEPKDWIDIGLEDEAGGVSVPDESLEKRRGERTRPLRGFDVELRRKPGEGFGFVIASQDVENGKAASLLPHRFVTVRRSSPAAKSGQIRAGDRLEAVEGRSVATLPHRELAQILRQAGNTLRLTVVPRPSTHSSNLSETAEHDQDHKSRKGQRSRPKRNSRYYSVDLDRGPSGFGFSLRGGSEYNMGLYVLGLMEGGPASRSKKIQVSDQLVEINGDSTAGMTHGQAVEIIRRGGQRIHLVLKRGNGYVPDYAREHRIASPSLLHNPKEQGLAAVSSAGRRGRTSKQKRRSGSSGDVRGNGTGMRRRRRPSSGGGGRSRLQSPVSKRGERDEARKRRSRSLPRDNTRKDDDHVDSRTVRGHDGDKEKRSSRDRERRSKSRVRKTKSEGEKPEQEEEQGAAAFEVKVGRRASCEEDDIFMPSPTRRLPRPKENWKCDADRRWDVAAEYRELKWDKDQDEERGESQDDDWDEVDSTTLDIDEENYDTQSTTFWRPSPAAAAADPASQRKPSSYLTSTLSVDELGDDGSELGSEDSVSAASISGSSLSARALPGPWLPPNQQRPVAEENRQPRSRTEPAGRGSAVS
ncbi:membrane-associated guanylate kinase, WW and PDZ domain-containing protein 1 isoform X4 [Nothobranchius furzeri]